MRTLRWLFVIGSFATLLACGDDDDDAPAGDGGSADGAVSVGCTPSCSGSQFCEPSICGRAGACVTTPVSCTREFDPVCGCDNKTYSNDCVRQLAKVGRAYFGECLQTGCNLTPTAGCCFDNADCTGRTCYGASMCSAGNEGVCKGPPGSGMCWNSRDCQPNERCSGAQLCPCGAACIVADSPGTCAAVN